MNIAIIDDLAQDRETIVVYLHTYFTDSSLSQDLSIYEFSSGEEFLSTFEKGCFDLIFIDYYMDGLSGLEVSKVIRQTDNQVILIFITTTKDFAIDAYKVKASGYLVKPIPYHEFSEILSLINQKEIQNRQYIEVNSKQGTMKVLLNHIIYCDIEGHYTQIHTTHTGIIRSRMVFRTIAAMLKPYKQFLPCYRGCIINMLHVERVDDMNFYMDNQISIPFRKKEQANMLKIYTDFMFEKIREESL